MSAIQLINDILRRDKLGIAFPWSTATIQKSPPDIRDESDYYLVLAPKGALPAFWLSELHTADDVAEMTQSNIQNGASLGRYTNVPNGTIHRKLTIGLTSSESSTQALS